MTPNQLKKMTNTTEKCEALLVEYIRMYANINTNYKNGWSYVVECWSDGDILEVLSDCQSNLPDAIAHIQSIVDINMERQEEHDAEARGGY